MIPIPTRQAKSLIVAAFLLVMLSGCGVGRETATGDRDLERLFGMMQGSFSSERQSKADTSYLNISLHMVPIWPGRGHYLYVEQALFARQEAPYRQRVYHVYRSGPGTFVSAIYLLPDEGRWAGAWKDPAAFEGLSPGELTPLEGCEVHLKKTGRNRFAGATREGNCPSVLRGAAYTTSEVEIVPGRMVSWDRGYNQQGQQVWGAAKGGYSFLRSSRAF